MSSLRDTAGESVEDPSAQGLSPPGGLQSATHSQTHVLRDHRGSELGGTQRAPPHPVSRTGGGLACGHTAGHIDRAARTPAPASYLSAILTPCSEGGPSLR